MDIKTKHILIENANIHAKWIFKKHSLVNVIDLFDEGIFFMYDKPQKRYSANSTTMAIWDLIDGNRTSAEIAGEIAMIGEVSIAEIEIGIFELLDILHELGFVDEVKDNQYCE